jgi:hypothetical protein
MEILFSIALAKSYHPGSCDGLKKPHLNTPAEYAIISLIDTSAVSPDPGDHDREIRIALP